MFLTMIGEYGHSDSRNIMNCQCFYTMTESEKQQCFDVQLSLKLLKLIEIGCLIVSASEQWIVLQC